MTTTELANFQRTWVVRSAGHPYISYYAVLLYDLHTMSQPPILYMPNATHEFAVASLDPKYNHLYKVGPDNEGALIELAKTTPTTVSLKVEHIYQFKAAGDDEAEQRMVFMLNDISTNKLFCDGDYYQLWDQYHSDCVSLRGK
jgi:hypothetical protein